MAGSLDISKHKINTHSIYFRSPGMPCWEKITRHSSMFIDLTSHILVFLVYLENKDPESISIFEDKYLKESTNIN